MNNNSSNNLQSNENEISVDDVPTEVFTELKKGVEKALETYSNVHRGSGHFSMVSTRLYEQARCIILECLGLNRRKYEVIFCSPRSAVCIMAQLKQEQYKCVSSKDVGLNLGVRALVIEKKALPDIVPFHTGGGTANLVSHDKVSWAQAPDKFEAGTPAIVNIIAFAKALLLMQQFGTNAFQSVSTEKPLSTEILYHDELSEYCGRELLDKLQQKLIGSNIQVPTLEGQKRYINLDNAASTPTFAPIWGVVYKVWKQNCSIQKEIIREVKLICSRTLGASEDKYDIIFTSNTTEAVNLVAETLGKKSENESESVVINTLLEHNSNELTWRMIPSCSLIRLSIDKNGFINLNELEAILCTYNQNKLHGKKRIKLVAISGASNVLGVYNDLSAISRIVHRYEAKLLVDAAQLVAHRKIEMDNDGIDYLAFSAHKVYAPFGTGVLIARKGLLNFDYNEQVLIQSSGEENVVGIAALGKALLLLERIGMDLIQEYEQALIRRAVRGLAQIPGVEIYGIKELDSLLFAQKGGVIAFSIKKIMANVIGKELAKRGGIGVRYGCHCAHMLVKHLLNVPPLLARFQHLIVNLFPQVKLPGIVRISLGIENCEEDVDTFISVLGKIVPQQQTAINQQSIPMENESKTLRTTDIKQQMNDFVKIAVERVYTQ